MNLRVSRFLCQSPRWYVRSGDSWWLSSDSADMVRQVAQSAACSNFRLQKSNNRQNTIDAA
jgi:hypothetical protein